MTAGALGTILGSSFDRQSVHTSVFFCHHANLYTNLCSDIVSHASVHNDVSTQEHTL